MSTWHCRVCGFEHSADDPVDLPWGADGNLPSFNFCACCGVEFGYQDVTSYGARRFRSLWLERGAPWDGPKHTPSDWDLDEQLKAVPDAYRTIVERTAWDPGWLDCDQSIAVGLEGEFVFWRIVPEHLRGPEALVFFNAGWDRFEDMLVARGRITAIRHPGLGDVRKVDTSGDNYRVYLADGTTFDVDQEQEPGSVVDAWTRDASGAPQPRPRPSVDARHWRMLVDFDPLSELRQATPPVRT